MGSIACDDAPSPRAKLDSAPAKSERPPEPTAIKAPAPSGPPELVIDTISPKVGFERALFQYPDGRQKLADALGQSKGKFGQDVHLAVERKANPAWVAAYLNELSKIDVAKVDVHTETRSEFSSQVVFTPEIRAGKPAPCSPVVMILSDRSTAVWKLGGGVAGRRPKGMAGPDLSMTAETIERVAKSCKGSASLFVASAPEVEWGLVFDLAASARSLLPGRFDSIVFVSTTPVPGHAIEFGR
ncbi:MAG TPA: hypothetical protein VFQ61_32855 [Polyangiaceae bacterium]|nr:hypothetical protein [Polyangiaceae bacterium]